MKYLYMKNSQLTLYLKYQKLSPKVGIMTMMPPFASSINSVLETLAKAFR